MHGTINVYYIWYGNWSGISEPHAMTVLQNLASTIGGTPYFNINTTYSDSSGTAVSNSVNFAGSTTDNYSQRYGFCRCGRPGDRQRGHHQRAPAQGHRAGATLY